MTRIAALALAFGSSLMAWSASAQTFTYTNGITGSDPTQVNRLFRNGIPSTVATPKPFPGALGGTYHYDSYGFTNRNASSIPVFVSITNPSIFSSAYSTSFNPANIGSNYLADAGSSGTLTYSFTVASGSSFFVNANEVIPNAGGAYTLAVSTTSTGLTAGVALAAPGPIAGAGLVPFAGLASGWFAWRRRRKMLAA